VTTYDDHGTRADYARVPVFLAVRFADDLYVVHDGGEVSLVDRETMIRLLRQLLPKEKHHD